MIINPKLAAAGSAHAQLSAGVSKSAMPTGISTLHAAW
jgi:hypothetical protein